MIMMIIHLYLSCLTYDVLDKETSMPIKSQEEKQYWTIFFEHNLYPGKTINLDFDKHLDIQSSKSTSHVPVKKASQIFKTRKWYGQTPIETSGANQPFGTFVWWHKKETDMPNQPCGFSVYGKKEVEKENQPFGTFVWWHKNEAEKEKQPFGFSMWDQRNTKKETQPFGFSAQDKKEVEKENQPFGTFVWWHKKEAEKEKQPFGFSGWDRKNTEKENQPFEFSAWDKKEVEKENQPFGTSVSWHKKEIKKQQEPFGFNAGDRKTPEKENQQFEFSASDKKEVEKENQPFGTFVWWHKKEIEKQKQPFEFNAWDRKNTEQENQPFGFNKWDKKESEKENQPHNEKEADILNHYCGTPSAIGEDKHCALSLESMMNFAISKLGKNIKVMSSSFSQSQDKYVVEEVKKIGDKAVMCHRLNFKKVVFYCHTINATTTYMVPLVTSNGTKSKALTICHHDTRGMNPNVLYEVLNVKPRNVHVCHFIGNKAVAWVPNVSESRGHPCVI